MMYVAVVSLSVLASANALRLPMTMQSAPGKQMKPTFDGTFKEAGAPLGQYVLENDNG